MSVKEDKLKMLQAMLAGKPTKESETLRVKTQIFEGNVHYNPNVIEESLNHVPSANDLNLTQQDLMLAKTGAHALPPVSEDDALALIMGKAKQPTERGLNLEHIQKLNNAIVGKTKEQVTDVDPYAFDPNPSTVSSDPFDMALRERENKLKQKLDAAKKNNVITEQKSPARVVPVQTEQTGDMTSIIEEIVYKVLGDILKEANEDAVSKETIKAKIGEAILFNKLTKAVINSSKK